MNRSLLFWFAAALLLAPAATAGPGHAGPTPIEEMMYVHFADDGLALSPAVPTTAAMQDSATAPPSCGSTHAWQAAFTTDMVSRSPTPLVRNADFDTARPTLTWYLQAFVPGTTTPSPVPMQDVTLHAAIRTGADLQTLGDGGAIAEATEVVTPTATTVEGVYALELKLPWANDPVIPGNETIQLEVTAAFGADACTTALTGMRAYADATMIPGIKWFIFDPIRIDSLDAEARNGTATIRLVASSPWGPDHFAPLPVPTLKGGSGPATGVRLENLNQDGSIQATWTWERGAAANGTYRADISIQDRNAAATYADNVVFRVGGDPIARPQSEAPATAKDTPNLPLSALVTVLAALAIMKNARRR